MPKSQFTASKGATSFSYETLIGSVSWAPMGSSRVGLKLLIEYYVVLLELEFVQHLNLLYQLASTSYKKIN